MPDETAIALPPDRVAQIYNWILDGAAEHEIAESAQHLWPDMDARPLMVQAMQRIAAAATAEPDAIRGWCIEATRHVYKKAIEAGDLATALRAVNQLAKYSS